MKKYGRHYLRRCLSVLLAVAMVCAAAQTLVFAVDLSDDDNITPGWYEGTARARYTTSGTLEITFPESTKSGARYYAEFYDLDAVDEQGNTLRETPVVSAFELTDASTLLAEGEDAAQVSVTLGSDWIKDQESLDLSHRISIAITAVSADGWRSEAIEALVGESLDVPDANYSPDGEDQYVSFANFDVNDNDTRYDAGDHPESDAPAWLYNGTNYAREGAEAFADAPMEPDGVFGGNKEKPESKYRYQSPGFQGSNAFRSYVKGQSSADYQTLDLMYNQDHWKFSNAEELWIWVDTSYVEFEEFAIQVRYIDYGGTQGYDRDQRTDLNDKAPRAVPKASEDSYSTVGYAKRSSAGGEDPRTPVYKVNSDGLWEKVYTNTEGYLENFGHYRGFLRVPVDHLYNDNTDSQYVSLNEERPYTYKIQIGYGGAFGSWETTEDNRISWNGKTGNNVPVSEIWQNPEALKWNYQTSLIGGIYNETFDAGKFKEKTKRSLSVTPIEDIASVGITWRGASEDSVNKPFYIDHIGFTGAGLETDDSDEGVVGSLGEIGMIPNAVESVTALFNQYIPSPEAVNVSNMSVLQDLVEICDRLGLDTSDIAKGDLDRALENLEKILEGQDVVAYLTKQLDQSDNLSSADIVELYELYLTFTLGQIHELGVTNEAKLIDLYNKAGQDIWYPKSLIENEWITFNDMEEGYTVGQTGLHEYDDNRTAEGNDKPYYGSGHILNWSNAPGDDDLKSAWENSKNLVAYSRSGYEDGWNDEAQRFGYGMSVIGQDGFQNSQSVNTEIFRSAQSGEENYRISLTAKGQDVESYSKIKGVNASKAEYLAFYADFTDMNDISNLWVTVRTGEDGAISTSKNAAALQFLDYNAPNGEWESIDSAGELNGKRGFVRIAISSMTSLNGTLVMSDVRQIKLFVTGDPENTAAEGSSFVIDMVGFLTSEEASENSIRDQYYEKVEISEPIENASIVFSDALDKIFTSADSVTEAPTLFNYTEDTKETYSDLIDAYNTMTLTEKKQADEALSTASGGAYTTVDQLQLFVKNYDKWGGLGAGKLQLNAEEAVSQRNEVEKAFNSSAGTELNTAPVVSILKAYAGYPDYYKYSVQTYWPDRNLNAVFPNYRPNLTVSGLAENDPVKLVLSEDGKKYTGTFTLPYVGAVAEDYGINFDKLPDDVLMQSADDQAAITVSIAWVEDQSVQHGENQSLVGTFTISADQIQHAGEYTGSFAFGIDKKADTGSRVGDAEEYRKTDITVHVKLVSEASFTVVIPADVQIPWGKNTHTMDNLCMENCFLPSGAHVDVSVGSPDNTYCMCYGDASIPYKLLSGEEEFKNHQFRDVGKVPLSVNVSEDDWDKAPVISNQYQDTLTFTVTYQEAK